MPEFQGKKYPHRVPTNRKDSTKIYPLRADKSRKPGVLEEFISVQNYKFHLNKNSY
jgi:hypothetical protein